MGDYVLTQHLFRTSRHSDSNVAKVVEKFSVLVSDYYESKDCLMIGNTCIFNHESKVIVVGKNHLEVASFEKYGTSLPDHDVTFDLNIEVIPYNRIKKISKTFHKVSYNDKALVFSAIIHLEDGEQIEIQPVETPNSADRIQYRFDLADNTPFLKQLTTVIEQLESKI